MLQRLFHSLLLFACLLVPLHPAAATLEVEPTLPPKHVARARNVDIQHVSLDLQFDWQKKQAFGTASITLAPLRSTRSVTLDAGNLSIERISLKTNTSLEFIYDGSDRDDALLVHLDREYAATESLTLLIRYRSNWVNASDPNNLWGSVGKGIRFFAPTRTEPRKRKQIWVNGEPNANRYWFPGYDGPNDLHSSEFIATVEKPLSVIANGQLLGTQSNANGTRRFHWRLDTPTASVRMGFVIGEYIDHRQQVGKLVLHSFSYPDELEATIASTVRLPDMLRFYSNFTGVDYPYPSYSQAFVQDLPWGISTATLSTQSENMVDDAGTHDDYLYLWDGLQGEALAGQWFGNYLSARDWRDSWLNRGFAHYFDGLYNEHKNGRAEFLLWHMLGDKNTYLADWNAGIRMPVVNSHYQQPIDFVGSNYPYVRGGMVLHILRKHLGEPEWQRAIAHYTRKHAGQMVSTADFQDAIEESSGESLDWFFEQWLYRIGHPVFTVSKRYDAARKELVLTVSQTQKPDPKSPFPQVEYFRGKVDIEIDGKIATQWLDAKAVNLLNIPLQHEPSWVNFDFESTWIKELSFPRSAEEWLRILRDSLDVRARNDAISELLAVAADSKTDDKTKAKIYTSLRKVISSDAYWRLRMNALQQLGAQLAPPADSKAATIDGETKAMLERIIRSNDKTWVRATALSVLGRTRDAQFAELYLANLRDRSDRVINAAAIALGKSKSPKAFDALLKLAPHPSWKNQSLISTLNGLKELGDPRGGELALKAINDLASPRWTLATPVWDYQLAAADTLVALKLADKAFPQVLARFETAMQDDDIKDIFSAVQLIVSLADARGEAVFAALKEKYQADANTMTAIDAFAAQLKEKLATR